jgi:hypothetical protein
MTIHTLLRALASGALCLGATCAQAQPVHQADLSLSLQLVPQSPLVPGSTALLTLTFTNSGPDALPAVGAGSSGFPHLDFEQFSLVAANPLPCTMYYDDFPAPPGQPSFLVATVFAGPIDAGESKSCTVAVRVAPTATESHLLEFHAGDGQVFIDDPNTANNRRDVLLEFGFPRAVIPVPLATPQGLPDFSLVANEMHVVDLLDAHMDRLQGVRSVLWVKSALLQGAREAARRGRRVSSCSSWRIPG